ncbi:MAG: hypothetical protein ACQCN6_11690 [Candidatus Bathyarchaeia archaeon]|jgi:hypothetical protein
MAGSIIAAVVYIALDVMLLANTRGVVTVISTLSIPQWAFTVYPIIGIVNACALFALYKWKKWGFYVLLTTNIVLFPLNVVILGFTPEVIAGLAGVIIISLLLRPKWSMLETGWPSIRNSLSLLLLIIALSVCIVSITPTSHMEDMITLVPQGENIASDSFKIDRPVQDTEISTNLTTQQKLHFEIIISKITPKIYGESSVTFTISNQSLSSDEPKQVYFTNDQIGLPDDYYMFWSAPQDGTYYFTLNYNYAGQNYISYNIQKVWNTTETTQAPVYTTLLAEYTAPTLIVGAALLATGAVTYLRRPRDIENTVS